MNHDVPSDKDEPSGRMASTVDLIANYRRPSWMDGADWERVFEFLQIVAAEFPLVDAAAKANFFYEAARVFECELNDDDMAVNCLQAGFIADPTHGALIDMGRRVFARVERWSMVCSFVEARVRTSLDKPARGRALLELAELYLFRFQKRAEAARCIERAIQLTANHPLARLYSVILTLIETPKDALSWINGRQMSGGLQFGSARAALAVLFGVFHDTKFASSDRLAAQLASLSDYPIMLRAAMCQHRFVGAIEAFHDAAALSLSELFQVESRAAYIYSLAMSALNEGLSTKRVVAYADELAETGVQKAPYFSLLGEACLLSGELDGAGAHFESAARWSQEPLWRDHYRQQALLSDAFAHKLPQAAYAAQFSTQDMDNSVIQHWLHGVLHVGRQMWDAFDTFLSQSRTRRERDCPLWAVDTWHLLGLRLHVSDRCANQDGHLIESLIDALAEQYGQAPLLELQRVTFDALSLRGQQAEARFAESRGDLLRLGVESVEACIALSRLLSPLNQEPVVDDAVYECLLIDPLGPILHPNEYLPDVADTRKLLGVLQARSKRVSEPNMLRDLLSWSAWLADHVGETEQALERTQDILRLGGAGISALIVGLRAARKLNQRDVAYELVCRLASLTTGPVEKAEYIAYSGLLLDEAVAAESMAHWQAACELNPECVTARFNIERRLGHNSDTTLRYLAERAAGAEVPTERFIYCVLYTEECKRRKRPLSLVDGALDLSVTPQTEAPQRLYELLLAAEFGDDLSGAKALKRLADQSFQQHVKTAYLAGAVRAFERSGDNFEAFDVARMALAEKFDHVETLAWVFRWLLETNDVDQMAAYLERFTHSEISAQFGPWIWMEAGRLLRLASHYEQASECYQTARHDAAADWLSLYYLRLMADKQGRPADAAATMLKLAKAMRDTLNRFDLAGDAAERFAAVGDDKRKLEAMHFAHLSQPEDEAMFERLRTEAERQGDWGGLAGALERALEFSSMQNMERILLLASILSRRLGDPVKARVILARHASRLNSASLWRRYADQAVEDEAYDDAYRGYQKLFDATLDPELRRAIALRISDIACHHLDDPIKGKEWLLGLLEADPADGETLMRLASVERQLSHSHLERLTLARVLAVETNEVIRANVYLRLAEIDSADRREDIATNRLRHAAAELTASPELFEQLADTLTDASDGQEKRAALTAAYQLTRSPADRARIGHKLEATGGPRDSDNKLETLIAACCNEPFDQIRIAASYQACEAHWAREHGLLRLVALSLSGHVDQAYEQADLSEVRLPAMELEGNGWSREAFLCLAQILECLPSVYQRLPDSLMKRHGPGLDGDNSIYVAVLPEWCFFKGQNAVCLSEEILSRDPRQIDLLIRWAAFLTGEQLDYLTRWTGDALHDIVAATNHSLGMFASGEPIADTNRELVTALQSSFESEPASSKLLAALGLVNQHGRTLATQAVAAYGELLRVVLTTGQDAVSALALLMSWLSSSTGGWEPVFERQLQLLVRDLLSGYR